MSSSSKENSAQIKIKSRVNSCLCCGSFTSLSKEWGVLSPFFAKRVMSMAKSSVIGVLRCSNCGSGFFDIDLSDKQLGKLYTGYRDQEYFEQRNSFEPWYSKKINDGIGGDKEFSKRRKVLIDALSLAEVDNNFNSVLDHGGDRGQMLADVDSEGSINAVTKCVYEISGVSTEEGVKLVSYDEMISSKWDLIISCHVLEHLPDPKSYLSELMSLGKSGSVYFFEVPDEIWMACNINKTWIQYRWLSWVVSSPRLLKWLHFFSVVFKLKLRFIPPLLFPALNEHLNFFTPAGLTKLLESSGLIVKACFIAKTGHIVAVSVKN